MKILAISGSTRNQSGNTHLLRFLSRAAPPDVRITLFTGLVDLPVFCADLEGDQTPTLVQKFCAQVHAADGVVISSPEYVHAIPGGLKNALDWLVQRPQIIQKPVALLHASHRGEDMLTSLRLVLRTVTGRFQEGNFERFSLMAKTPLEIETLLSLPQNSVRLTSFLENFRNFAMRKTPYISKD